MSDSTELREPVWHGYRDGWIAGYRDEIRNDGLQTTYPGWRWKRGYAKGREQARKDLVTRRSFGPSREMERAAAR